MQVEKEKFRCLWFQTIKRLLCSSSRPPSIAAIIFVLHLLTLWTRHADPARGLRTRASEQDLREPEGGLEADAWLAFTCFSITLA